MTVQHTDPATAEDRMAAIAEIRERFAAVDGSPFREAFSHWHLDDVRTLLSELEAAQARLDKTREALVETAVEMYHFWQFAGVKEGEGPSWTPEITAREEGKFRGAAWALQGFLVSLGEADEEDDEAGAAHEAIEAARALGLGEEGTEDGR